MSDFKCDACGGELVYNVPRLGAAGGFVHKETGQFLCGPRIDHEYSYVCENCIELKKLCRLAGVPQILIDNPRLCSGEITEEDLQWAKKEVDEWLKRNQ